MADGSSSSSTTTTTSTSTSTVSSTTQTTPSPPTTWFPCKDASPESCESSVSKDKAYCNKNSANYAFARSNCCYSCAMALGFTVSKPSRIRQPNGKVIVVLVNVVGKNFCYLYFNFLHDLAMTCWFATPLYFVLITFKISKILNFILTFS